MRCNQCGNRNADSLWEIALDQDGDVTEWQCIDSLACIRRQAGVEGEDRDISLIVDWDTE